MPPEKVLQRWYQSLPGAKETMKLLFWRLELWVPETTPWWISPLSNWYKDPVRFCRFQNVVTTTNDLTLAKAFPTDILNHLIRKYITQFPLSVVLKTLRSYNTNLKLSARSTKKVWLPPTKLPALFALKLSSRIGSQYERFDWLIGRGASNLSLRYLASVLSRLTWHHRLVKTKTLDTQH